MRKRHLRLVAYHNVCCGRKDLFKIYLEKIKERFKSTFTSKKKKIYELNSILINIFKEYEISTGMIDLPYFLRAEEAINKIIKEKKVDYYYELFEKFRKNKTN